MAKMYNIIRNNYIKYRDYLYFSLITLLGIFVRIFFVFRISSEPISDFSIYHNIASNIFMHKGHTYLESPIAFQGVGYPMILGYFYRILGDNSIFTAKVFNLILSSLTLVLILLILLKLINKRRTVYLSYIIIVFTPNYIAYNNVLGTEILTTFLLSVIIYLQICSFNPRIRYSIIGIFTGVAALTKPYFLAYPFILALIEWLKYKNIKKSLKSLLLSFIFLCLIVAPWTYRNYKKFNLFIPISYNGGYVLFINNNDNNKNGAWMPVSDIDVSNELKSKFLELGFQYRVPSISAENQIIFNPKFEKLLKKEAQKWIYNHPYRFCTLGIKRVNNTFFNGAGDIYEWAMNSKQTNIFSNVLKSNFFSTFFDRYIYIVSISGFTYILINLKKVINAILKKRVICDYIISIPFFNILFSILICFVFEGQQRYNFPILFLFSICMSTLIEKTLTYISTLIKRDEVSL